MWPFDSGVKVTITSVTKHPTDNKRRYRLVEHTNFIENGRSHYTIDKADNSFTGWTSINDDYGFRTLKEAEDMLEGLRHRAPKQETIILKEVEYD